MNIEVHNLKNKPSKEYYWNHNFLVGYDTILIDYCLPRCLTVKEN